MGLSVDECIEIEAYAAREPLHERRADIRVAMAAFVAARAAGAKGMSVNDLIIDWGAKLEDDAEQTPEEMNRQMEKLVGIFEAQEKQAG